MSGVGSLLYLTSKQTASEGELGDRLFLCVLREVRRQGQEGEIETEGDHGRVIMGETL